ncbi:PREDICTED: uncharacterized protein LOC107881210 [Prunus mume]|uniref:Uncharacterized protein LOC107881210 n=1 Tax=Prunus mume TaxID=102107 RepID=A0ABM1LRH0_PRUMU|nr:PREDICTED: uncharacterized protein LOC107881210 [Prunus mume]
MRHCFSVKYWASDMAMEELPTHMVQYWVQAHGIPLNLMNKECGGKIGGKLGKVLKLEDKGGSRGYLRFQVDLDSRNRLVNGFWLPRRDGSISWVELRYEKLGDFCFCCGRLGHKNSICPANNQSEERSGYGSWLAVEPVRLEHTTPPQPQVPNGGRRKAGEKGVPGQRPYNCNGATSAQRLTLNPYQGGQQNVVRPPTIGGSLRGMSGTEEIVGTSSDEVAAGQHNQPNTDSSGRDNGPNGMVTSDYDNSLALVELNFPSQIVRPSNCKGPLSFEQVMDLRRAPISMGHQYIMDWDTPGPSMSAPRVEDNNPYIGNETHFRNPFDTTLRHTTPISAEDDQRAFSHMGLKRPAKVEWQDVGREQKRSRRLGKEKILTLLSPKKLTRGGRSSHGGSRGKV